MSLFFSMDPVIEGLLAHCFYQSMFTNVDYTGSLPRLQWLLELMGHVKNIATGTVTLLEQSQPLAEVRSSRVLLEQAQPLAEVRSSQVQSDFYSVR